MLVTSDIVNFVAEKSKLPLSTAGKIVRSLLEEIEKALIAGEDVKIEGFGRFRVHNYPSQSIPDPQGRGHHIIILPRKVIKFKPGLALRAVTKEPTPPPPPTDSNSKPQHPVHPPETVHTLHQIEPTFEYPPETPVSPGEAEQRRATPDKQDSDAPKKESPDWLVLFSKLKGKETPPENQATEKPADNGPIPLKKPDGQPAEPNQPQPKTNETFKEAVSPVQIAFRDLSSIKVAKEVLNLLPEMFARHHQAVVLDATPTAVTVAMVDPENLETIQLIKKSTGRDVTPVLASSEDIERVLNQYSGLEAEVANVMKDSDQLEISKKELAEAEHENVESGAEDSPTSKIVLSLLRRAVREKASDVHIEPYEKAVMVRFRIDGVLRTRVKLPKEIQAAVISRLKILANLKIDEHRLPQDGRFRINIDNNNVDFRLSTLPVADGEKAVMRILDKSQGILSIEEIGVTGHPYDVLKSNIKKSYGMTIVCGPTGSGKTTTLYALLGQLMDVSVNIITLEDPIEYRIEGLNQSQVNPDIGYDFSNGLRAIVRQDPDIIMVGEIRDKDTAEIAIQSALTGHIVISTLHTNNASGAIPRLIDMGVEPFLISSSLNTIVAQRLARKLCSFCKVEHAPSAKELEIVAGELAKLPPDPNRQDKKESQFFIPKGCDACNMTGYQGRLGLFEILDVTEPIENLILSKSTDTKLAEEAIKEGMITMLQDGLLKAKNGLTSLEEVWRVTRD